MATTTKPTAGGDDFAEDLAPFMELLRSRRAAPPAAGGGGVGAEGVVRRPTVRVVATAEGTGTTIAAMTTVAAAAAVPGTLAAAGVRPPELPAYVSGEG